MPSKLCSALLLAVAAAIASACSGGELSEKGVSSQAQPIIGGALDSQFDAVMALVEVNEGVCSGTVIAVRGQSGYLLTAAHCVASATANPQGFDPENLLVIPGPDWEESLQQSLYYPVEEFEFHPSYDGSDTSPADIAVVRFSGADSSMPTIPAMSADEDDVEVGSQITLVGYGRTSVNGNPVNSQRYRLNRTVVSTPNVAQFVHDETDGAGTCGGDSGGPALSNPGGGMRVAGVTSFGASPCASVLGGSVRVSAYESFITGFVEDTPTEASCGTCLLLESLPQGSCGDEGAACGVGTDCDEFLLCLEDCGAGDDACAQDCFTQHEQGQADYLALVLCSCNEGCDSECADDDRCDFATCGFEFSDATCNDCNESQCCAETSACALDPDCAECVTSADPPFSCAQNQLYEDFRTCTAERCETECQVPQCRFSADGECGSCLEDSCCAEASACDADGVCAFCLSVAPDDACAENEPLLDLLGCLASCDGDPCELGVEPAGEGGAANMGEAGQSAGGQSSEAGSGQTAAGSSAGGTGPSDAGETRAGAGGETVSRSGDAGAGGSTDGTDNARAGAGGESSAQSGSAGDSSERGHSGASGENSKGEISDAGAAGADGEGASSQNSTGCSCRTAGGARRVRASFGLWLLAALAFARRRRKGVCA